MTSRTIQEAQPTPVNHQCAIHMSIYIVICGIQIIICYIIDYLHLRIDECKASVIGKHTKADHVVNTLV